MMEELSNRAITVSFKRFRLQVWKRRLAELNNQLLNRDVTITTYQKLIRKRNAANERVKSLRV